MNLIKPEHALRFILGGKANFVLWNKETGNRFTYGVWTSKHSNDILLVYCAGTFLGRILKIGEDIEFHKGKDILLTNVPVKVITWYLHKLVYAPAKIPENVIMYHLGACAVCGRKLTDPISVELGIGPKCRGEH